MKRPRSTRSGASFGPAARSRWRADQAATSASASRGVPLSAGTGRRASIVSTAACPRRSRSCARYRLAGWTGIPVGKMVRDEIKTDDHPVGAVLIKELERKVAEFGA